MRYLVTGGCGFIGSSLVKVLAREGHEVVVVDNLSTGSLDNLESGFRVLGDVKEVDGKVDGIFHLGMPSSTLIFREKPSLFGKTVEGFLTLLELCKSDGVKIVYASSSSLYNGNRVPFREDMNILPKDIYTETLYSIERLAGVYNEFFGVKSVGLRLFSVYGDNERAKGRYANVVSQMLWAKEEGRGFDVYDMDTTRDFIQVDDVVRAFTSAMESGVSSGVINVGTGKAYSFRKIVEAIGLRDYRVVENPISNYVRETLADTTKAGRVLGFEAESRVMDYIKSRLSQG